MGDARVLERIEAWEAIGLIDHETADRLRSAEAAAPEPETERSSRGPSVATAFFGPAVSVAELFVYLGGAFVLAAWHTILASYAFRDSGIDGAPNLAILLAQYAGPAIVLSMVGLYAIGGPERQRRFAGVAFSVATWHILQTVQVGLQPSQATLQNGLSPNAVSTVAAGAAVLAALVYRRVHPAVLTQLTLLASAAFLASRLLQLLEDQWYWPLVVLDGTVDPGLARTRVGVTILWWLAFALVFGLAARYERRRAARQSEADDDGGAAARRASVSALAAGLTAIGGTATAIMQSNGNSRALEPWLGDVAILAVALLLLAVAFRRGASAYLYPGALGLIVALSDLNSHYVAERVGSGVALLVEGAILLGAGLFADRIRRRLGARSRDRVPGEGAGGMAVAISAMAAAPAAGATAAAMSSSGATVVGPVAAEPGSGTPEPAGPLPAAAPEVSTSGVGPDVPPQAGPAATDVPAPAVARDPALSPDAATPGL